MFFSYFCFKLYFFYHTFLRRIATIIVFKSIVNKNFNYEQRQEPLQMKEKTKNT